MKLEGEGKLLRVVIGESDRAEGKPLYEVIVARAREHGLAGATVLRGVEGFGSHSQVHTKKILTLSADLPNSQSMNGAKSRCREVCARSPYSWWLDSDVSP